MIEAPNEFSAFGVCFDPDLRSDMQSGQDRIDFALSNIGPDLTEEIRAFLVNVLAADLQPGELTAVWDQAASRRGFHPEAGLRLFLENIVERMEGRGQRISESLFPLEGRPAQAFEAAISSC